jgi:hypothetical protein
VTAEQRVWLVLTVLATRWEADSHDDTHRDIGFEHLALIDARDELVRRGLADALPDADLWPASTLWPSPQVASPEPS